MPIETLALDNFGDDNIVKELELSADAASGQAVINLIDTDSLAANDYLVILPGLPTGELRQINTGGISGQQVTLSTNLSETHRNHQRVIKLFGNQIKVYRAADVNGLPPATSSFTLLGTVTIDPDQEASYYTDSNGGSAYWYLFTYYNQFSGAETDITLSEPLRGGSVNDYCSEEEVMDEAGLSDNKSLKLWQVAVRKREAQDHVRSALLSAGYLLPLQTGTGVPFTPDIVVGITKRLAAGYLLQKNFGTTKPGSAKDGKAKVDEAEQELAKIQLNDLVLVDSNGNMLAKPNLVFGWPDDTTIDDPNSTTPGPLLTFTKKF